MLQSEAGYIDARPKSRQIDETLLRRTAGPYMWAIIPASRAAKKITGTAPISCREPSFKKTGNRCRFFYELPEGHAEVSEGRGSKGAIGRRASRKSI
jgi:hypothetical protein